MKRAFPTSISATKISNTSLERAALVLVISNGRVTSEDLSAVLGIDVVRASESLENLKNKGVLRYCSIDCGDSAFELSNGDENTSPAFPSSSIIPLSYQFNLLSDNPRLLLFAQAISTSIRPLQNVLDVGCGTGILSILAARKGAKVIAVEIDPLVCRVAQHFVEAYAPRGYISLIQADALGLKLDGPMDVIICEMLDTGLIAELQIPMMNYALRNLLRPGSITIPAGVICSVALAEVDFSTAIGLTFPLPHFDRPETNRIRRRLSPPIPYIAIDFSVLNNHWMNAEVEIVVEKTGIVNAFIIETQTILAPGIIATGSCWLNPPLIIPVSPLARKAGSSVSLKLSYLFGGGLSSLQYDLS